ncbi:unnamed protein product, partial [Polarella glacialis]
VVAICIGEHLGQSCGHIHIVSPPAFVVIAGYCFSISFLLWARILLAYSYVLISWAWWGADDTSFAFGRQLSISSSTHEELSLELSERDMTPPCSPDHGQGNHNQAESDQSLHRHAEDEVPSFASIAASFCGLRASQRLVEPLRARKPSVAVAALGFLASVAVFGQRCGSYKMLRGELDACLGPLLSGEGVTQAPVWLSEFGTDVRDQYWEHMIRYLGDRELDFAYWSINGEKRFNESETYGLLKDDSLTIRHPWKLEMLMSLVPHRRS